MIKSSIEKLAKDIGFDIGMSDDEVQANLLNGFSKALHNSMSKDKREMQLCYIVNKLDNKAKILFKELYEFIELNYENTKQTKS